MVEQRPSSHRQWGAWLGAGLLLLATALRSLGLSSAPPGLRYDEVLNSQMAAVVANGELPLYFAGSWGHEPIFHYLQGWSLALLGANYFSLRLPAIFLGVLAVATLVPCGRLLLNRRVGWLAAAFLSVSFWGIFYSRLSLRLILIVPLANLQLLTLWRACQLWERGQPRRSLLLAGLSGLLLTANVYTYPSGRVMAALPLLIVAWWLWQKRLGWRPAGMLIGAAFLIAGVLSWPLIRFLQANPQLQQRGEQLGEPLNRLLAGEPALFLSQIPQAYGMYVWRGEADWLYNVYERPIFEPLAALIFLLGVAWGVWCWRRSPALVVLGWLAVGSAPSILFLPAASLTHAIAAQGAAYLLLGLGLDVVWRWGAERPLAARLMPLAAAGLWLIHALSGGVAYFQIWAQNVEVARLYQAGMTAAVDTYRQLPEESEVVIAAPFVDYFNPWNVLTFELMHGATPTNVRWVNPAAANLLPEGTAVWLHPRDPLGPNGLAAELYPPAAARWEASQNEPQLAIYHQEQLPLLDGEAPELAWPPESSAPAPPTLPLTFGNRLQLVAVELLESQGQAGEPLRLLTTWNVLQADSTPLMTFLHLTSDGVDIRSQVDRLDLYIPSLQVGDRFTQLHLLTPPADIAPGDYQLQLGMYHPETAVRLTIQDGADGQGDRVWVGQVEFRP